MRRVPVKAQKEIPSGNLLLHGKPPLLLDKFNMPGRLPGISYRKERKSFKGQHPEHTAGGCIF